MRTPSQVLSALAEVERLLVALGPDLAPERIPARHLGEVVRSLGAIERRVRGARLVLRKAAADTGEWKARGATSPAEHVARQEGISVGQAKAEIEASARLERLPRARDAVASGELSTEQAKVVAEGAAADPRAESRLVRTARERGLRAVRDEARTAIARADERSGERARRIHQRRALKAWVSLDGEGHAVWNIPGESHARVMAALEPYRREAFRRARDAGERLSEEAILADALDMLARDVLLDHEADAAAPPVRTAPAATPAERPHGGPTLFATEADAEGHHDDGDGTGGAGPQDSQNSQNSQNSQESRVVPMAGPRPATPAPRNRRAPAQVHVLVDLDALRRGHATDGETCEIHGLGPIPVALAEHIMQDSLLRLIVTGTDVTTVSSHRRYIPEPVRRAVFARDHGTCVVPGCGATRYLEYDHCFTDFAADGPTEYGNLALVCRRHHVLKTIAGWILRHTAEHGWTFVPPVGTDPDPP